MADTMAFWVCILLFVAGMPWGALILHLFQERRQRGPGFRPSAILFASTNVADAPVDGLMDIKSFDEDGFTIAMDDTEATGYRVAYMTERRET